MKRSLFLNVIIEIAFTICIFLSAFVSIFLLVLSLDFLLGCSTIPTTSSAVAVPLNPIITTQYRYDLSGTVNGVPFNGVGVIPYATSYDISIVSPSDVDLFTVSTCERDKSINDAAQVGWFQRSTKFTYHFVPNKDSIENTGSCLVRLGTFNKTSGEDGHAILDFQTPEATLPATVFCDGNQSLSSGVSMCMTQQGLIEQIVFPVPVIQDKTFLPAKCQMQSSDGGITWQYLMPSGECVIAFMETARPNRIHRLTTVGYQQIQIRGSN